MKRLLVLSISLLFLFGCSKYEEGPSFSLRSKHKRIIGVWDLVSINGQSPSNTLGYVPEFYSLGLNSNFESYMSGSDGFTYGFFGEGSWRFSDDKTQLITNHAGEFNHGQTFVWNVTYDILRLTYTELKLSNTINDVEFTYTKYFE